MFQGFWGDAMRVPTDNPLWETFDRFRQTNADFDLFGHPLRDFFPAMHLYQSRMPFDSPWSTGSTDRPNNNSHQPDRLTDQDEHNVALTVLALAGRRLVTTVTGYMGLVPEDTCEEDVIAVLRGCNFPVALRPAGGYYNDNLEFCRYYKYVGECYVHGIMDGETLEAMDRGELQEVDIILI